mgnify:CR=1 FL=1
MKIIKTTYGHLAVASTLRVGTKTFTNNKGQQGSYIHIECKNGKSYRTKTYANEIEANKVLDILIEYVATNDLPFKDSNGRKQLMPFNPNSLTI